MALRLVAVTVDAHDPWELAGFWGGLLAREVVTEPDGALLPGDDAQVGLRFVASSTEKAGPNRLHLHLTSATPEDQQRTVETALRLGGRHLDVGQLPEEDHIVLGDPGGNAFCVIEASNGFLAGCGLLDEVSCLAGSSTVIPTRNNAGSPAETDLVTVTWSVLHTDPAPEAFVHDDSAGVTGLIDWSGARRGPGLYDVASAVLYLGGTDGARAFLSAYRSHGPLAADELELLDWAWTSPEPMAWRSPDS